MKTSLKLLVGAGLLAASMASFARHAGRRHHRYGARLELDQRHDAAAVARQQGRVDHVQHRYAGYGSATGKQGTTKVTIGQCTKCHTPHQAKSTNLLWNHTLQAITYKWDEPETTAGTAVRDVPGRHVQGPDDQVPLLP